MESTSIEVAIAVELVLGQRDALPHFRLPGGFQYRSGVFSVDAQTGGFEVRLVFIGPRQLGVAFDSGYLARVVASVPRDENTVEWAVIGIGTFIEEEINAAIASGAAHAQL